MLSNAKEKNTDMELINESFRDTYKERFLNQIFEEVSFYFSKKIDAKELTNNIIENIKFKNNMKDFNFITESFFILDLAFIYYKANNNKVMSEFLQNSIVEAHLFYLENNYQGYESIYFNEDDEMFIDNIIEKHQ